MPSRLARLAAAWLLAGMAGGCRLPEPVEPVNFAVDDDEVREQQLQRRVDEAADRMKSDPDLHLRLVGHADEDNSEDYNEALALRRAQEVAARMVQRHPTLESRIDSRGRGEWDPVVRGDEEAAKAQNRRVEFVFFYPRQCEAAWSEAFAECLVGRIEPEPEPEPEAQPEPQAEPVPAPAKVEKPWRPEFVGPYGFVGVGWSVTSYDLPRQHLPWGFMAGYVWAPTNNLRLSLGGELDHHAYLGFLFGSDEPQCSGGCAAPLHVVRVLPEARVGGRSGRMWAHIRVFGGPAIIVRPEIVEQGAGSTSTTIPASARAVANLGVGPGFTFALTRRLMLSLDFEVSFDGRVTETAGIYGGKLSFGAFMGR